jgi:hypothetical protein
MTWAHPVPKRNPLLLEFAISVVWVYFVLTISGSVLYHSQGSTWLLYAEGLAVQASPSTSVEYAAKYVWR